MLLYIQILYIPVITWTLIWSILLVFKSVFMLIGLLNILDSTPPVTQRYFQHITNTTYITVHKPTKQLQSICNICTRPLFYVRSSLGLGKKELFCYFISFHEPTPVIALVGGIMFSSCLSICISCELNISRPPEGISSNLEQISKWTQVWTDQNLVVKVKFTMTQWHPILVNTIPQKCLEGIASNFEKRKKKSSVHHQVELLQPLLSLPWRHTHLWTEPSLWIQPDTCYLLSVLGCGSTDHLHRHSIQSANVGRSTIIHIRAIILLGQFNS